MQFNIKENSLDFETYYSLREAVEWNNWSQEQAENALKNSYYSIVVLDDETPVGMGRVVGDGIYFTIVDVVVRPEYQGKKIGTLIIESIVSHIEKNMIPGSRVCIQLIAAEGKEPFYEKLGFYLVPNESCGSALSRLIFT